VARAVLRTNEDEDDNMIGTSLADRYEIVRLLGRGGMGRVYEAIQVAFGRRVALKLLKREYVADLEQIRRFYVEARSCSRLEHPSTIRVYDFGVTDEGVPFLAMELLEGETLKQRLKRVGALSEEDILDIAVPVTSALVEAHHAGIVHRDLKPDNIYLKHVVGAGEIVKVCDFGIAKLVGFAGGDDESLTGNGVVVGTPKYMSPEQVRDGDVGPWTDLYAVGTMIFEALTGQPPFTQKSAHKLMLAKVRTSPPKIPEMGLRGPISPALRALVDALLISDATYRPRDTAEVVDWLESIADERYEEVPVNELRSRNLKADGHVPGHGTPPPPPPTRKTRTGATPPPLPVQTSTTKTRPMPAELEDGVRIVRPPFPAPNTSPSFLSLSDLSETGERQTGVRPVRRQFLWAVPGALLGVAVSLLLLHAGPPVEPLDAAPGIAEKIATAPVDRDADPSTPKGVIFLTAVPSEFKPPRASDIPPARDVAKDQPAEAAEEAAKPVLRRAAPKAATRKPSAASSSHSRDRRAEKKAARPTVRKERSKASSREDSSKRSGFDSLKKAKRPGNRYEIVE
jgi:serine/threonine protein kinase